MCTEVGKRPKVSLTLRAVIIILFLVFTFNLQVFALPPEPVPPIGENTPAQGDAQQDAQNEDLIATILATDPSDAALPNTSKPEVPVTAYSKSFPYGQDYTLHGIFSSHSLFFEVPNYWTCGYVYAQIEYTLSQLIDNVPASLTFSVNNVPVYSCKMDYKYGKTQTVYVPIPLSLVREGFNEFNASGYVRLYDENGCVDDLSGANWVSISKSSVITVGYDIVPHNSLISYYPYPFMSTIDPMGKSVGVYVSDQMTNAEMTAALLLRADLGTEAVDEDHILFGTASQLYSDAAIKNKLLIANTKNLPDEFKGFLKDKNGKALDLRAQASVQFIKDRDGNPLLLITSDDDECLTEAAAMLMDENRVTQEKSSAALVKKDISAIIKQSSSLSDLVAGKYTIDALVDSGLTFVGPFHQVKDIFLPFSGGYILSEAGKIVLNFRYSENLNFDRSMVTVYWDTTPVASKKLTKENAAADQLSFSLPADVVGTAASKISIAFDLELPDLFCTPRVDQMPWAYVTTDSTFYLPVGKSNRISFETRPAPFQVSGLFNDLLVVIPDAPTVEDLNTLGVLVSVYGDSVSPYGSLRVVRGSEVKTGDDGNLNMIVFGRYDTNSFIKTINPKLNFQYNQNGTALVSNDQLVLANSYAADIASLQLVRSPYGEDKSLLVVTATNAKSQGYIGRFASVEKNLWGLKGDTILLDSELKLKTFTFLKGVGASEPLNLIQTLEENKASVVFTVVATASVLLLLLAVILVLLRIAAYKKKE